MKITLTHDDVLLAVRDHLLRQGFVVPETTDLGAFNVFYDEQGGGVTLEVDHISVAAPARLLMATA